MASQNRRVTIYRKKETPVEISQVESIVTTAHFLTVRTPNTNHHYRLTTVDAWIEDR